MKTTTATATTDTTDTIHSHLDLWEAWIDMQNPGNNERGTLYIIGDVTVNNRIIKPYFVKRESGTNHKYELVLEIMPLIICDKGYAVEIFYSEELQLPNQYKFITIYCGNQIIARINEIEVLL